MNVTLAPAIAVGVFAAVILAIASNRMHMTVAASLGAVILLMTGVLSAQQTSETINPGEDTIALFFGGMVMARTLIPTGLFDFLGGIVLRLVRGEGRRLMIAIVIIAAPVCAVLPNATVVILLAPLIVKLCQRMNIDFAPPVMLLVFVANSSGLLTLVGDPATFIVGNSIGLSFAEYLHLLSPGALLVVLGLIAILPLSFRSVWRARVADTGPAALPRIERPMVMLACLAVLAVMIGLFVTGESLPNPIAPPAVAILGSTLVLLIAYWTRLDDVGAILRDVDWESLLFFVFIFILVGALEKTGVIAALGSAMGELFGTNVASASLLLLFAIGILSSVIPNIALVVAMVPLVKQFAVGAGLASQAAIEAGYGQMPASVASLFFAMCFGATLGGNATLLGASSNIVASGICARAGRPLSFMRFMRYGVPVTAVQLLISAAYIWLRFL
ncbi:MAG TPA: SLC13 family permease [Stellaceae bacterium]|nr:SLC13 family permease [Stellaceae bacterium]